MGEGACLYSHWNRDKKILEVSSSSNICLQSWFSERSWLCVASSPSSSNEKVTFSKTAYFFHKKIIESCAFDVAGEFLSIHVYHCLMKSPEFRLSSALRISKLLKSIGFAVSEVRLRSDRRSVRKSPPRRRYALVSFHPDDVNLIRNIYPILYECFEPYLCRPFIDHDLESENSLEFIKNRVYSADFFVPLITSSYKKNRSVRLDAQFRTAVERMPLHGSYWVFPLVFDSTLDGDLLTMAQKYTGMLCLEGKVNFSQFKKELRSVIRMIFETWQVFK